MAVHGSQMRCFVVSVCFAIVLSSACLAQQAKPEAKPEQKPEMRLGKLPPRKTADELFAEAAKLAEKQPQDAIPLYVAGLRLKADAWEARMQLGALYERTNSPSQALIEYQAAHARLRSAESFAGVARALAKCGSTLDSAFVAETGAARFAKDAALQRLAGERLVAVHQPAKALTYLQAADKLKPGVADTLAMLGAALDDSGRPVDALKSFKAALAVDPAEPTATSRLKSLMARAIVRPGFILLPPSDWHAVEAGMENAMTGRQIVIKTGLAGVSKDVASSLASQDMPADLITARPGGMDRQIADQVMHEKQKHGKTLTPDDVIAQMRPKGGASGSLAVEEITGKQMPASLACASVSEDTTIVRSSCVLTITVNGSVTAFTMQGRTAPSEARALMLGLTDMIVLSK